jgi:hypothetical protein
MIELPPIVLDPPASVDRAGWERLSDGERLRWLKAHQYELHLTRNQFLELSRVPFWAAYGPEHGLPADLFNEQGFLLPKYRPGGGLYDDFRRWRRTYRLASWRQLRLRRRVERFLHGPGAFTGGAWLMIGVFLAKLLSPALQDRFVDAPELVLLGAVVLVHCLAGALLALLAFALVSRCIVRGSIRVIGKPPGC